MSSSTLAPLKGSSGSIFFKSQFCTKPVPIPASISFAGQTAVVTGSNGGIGLAACREMLDRGLSRLILAVRSAAKGEAAAARLRTAHPGARIEVWALDMTSYKSITAFSQRCSAELQRLDLAILNAGVTLREFRRCEDAGGHEEVFQVNYLSTALLAILLLPVLSAGRAGREKKQQPGRLTIVASGLGILSEFPNRDAVPLIPSFDDSTDWTVARATERYNTSKTLPLMFVERLGRIVSSEDIIINAVDPGLTGGSGLHADLPGPIRAVMGAVKMVAGRPLKDAASTYLHAVAVNGKESHGSFLMDWAICPWHPMMYTPEGKKTADRLWDETMRELNFAGVEGILEAISAK
ncbi:short-chain dehydrogenase [Xylariales sp. PMI_506]|nr:short-chain dehydrogenase [Xylariales sp. PMI_506]